MVEFFKGVYTVDEERAYQAWLARHRPGLVLGANRNRKSRRTVHGASCFTVGYPLDAKKQRRRSGKTCFDNPKEFDDWCRKTGNPSRADLNIGCPQCPPGDPA